MRNAAKTFLVLILVAALAACGSNGEQQDNRANAVEVNSSVVEVDTLPPDESSTTPTDQLANGATETTEALAESNAGY